MLETSIVKTSISYNSKKNPIIAAVASFFIPGFGQIYSGEVRKGIGFFLIGATFAMFEIFLIRNNNKGMELGSVLVAGLAIILCWIFIVYDAYKTAKEIGTVPKSSYADNYL